MKSYKKSFYAMIPNIFTVCNLILGLVSIIFSIDERFQLAAVLILFSGVLDSMDGRMARRFDASSLFGKELDSLSDLVSFGVAPALLMYQQILQENFGLWGLFAVILFVTCGALRLARFNVLNISGYFLGIPITAAGGLIALVSLLAVQINSLVILIFMIFLSLLMVSNLKVPKY